MRMWMIPPKTMCRKHLLGEHSEIHKHRHVFVKGDYVRSENGKLAKVCMVIYECEDFGEGLESVINIVLTKRKG